MYRVRSFLGVLQGVCLGSSTVVLEGLVHEYASNETMTKATKDSGQKEDHFICKVVQL